MKWLTKSEIARRAKKSYKEALLVSIEHHQQIAKSTRKEFFTAVGLGKVSISSAHCGICQWKAESDCIDCFLGKGGRNGCGAAWEKIHKAIDNILTDGGTWTAVVKAENNMVKILKRELRKQ